MLVLTSICAQQSPKIIKNENEKIQLVDVHKLDSTILLDIRYATKNNITKTKISDTHQLQG